MKTFQNFHDKFRRRKSMGVACSQGTTKVLTIHAFKSGPAIDVVCVELPFLKTV